MINSDNLTELVGATVYGTDGDKIGTVGQVYVDDVSGQPSWVTVKTGLFGTSQSFAPIDGANFDGGDLRLAYAKELVKDAPRVDDDGTLEADDEAALYSYYGRSTESQAAAAEPTSADATNATGTVGYDTSGPTTDDAMTRSEERLHVGTERVETGRARLRKHVLTETQTVTVPVSHEEVTLHREPITDANIGDATSGPAISEEEHEVVLTGERVITSKETVPVERVSLGTETVTEQQSVTEDVRKEEIDLVDPDTAPRTDVSDDDRSRPQL
jgi:uncharacterized protein (TIGR02271 family)